MNCIQCSNLSFVLFQNDSSSLQSHKNYSPVFKLVLNTPEGGGDDEVGEVRRQRGK